MGDLANDIMDGWCCQYCLRPMPDGEEPGYPRTCPECPAEDEDNDNG